MATLDDFTPQVTKKMKLREGDTYRIAFPWCNSEGKLRIEGVRYFSRFDDDKTSNLPESERIKVRFQVTEDEELNAIAEQVCGAPVIRYVTPVLVYEADSAGKVSSSSMGKYKIEAWVFADQALTDLKTINAEWGITTIDVSMKVKDPYLNVTLTPLKNCYYKSGDYAASFDKVAIQRDVDTMAKNIQSIVAPVWSKATILEKLKVSQASRELDSSVDELAKDGNIPLDELDI